MITVARDGHPHARFRATGPPPDAVFEALDDACRDIISALDGPMTASRIADEAA